MDEQEGYIKGEFHYLCLVSPVLFLGTCGLEMGVWVRWTFNLLSRERFIYNSMLLCEHLPWSRWHSGYTSWETGTRIFHARPPEQLLAQQGGVGRMRVLCSSAVSGSALPAPAPGKKCLGKCEGISEGLEHGKESTEGLQARLSWDCGGTAFSVRMFCVRHTVPRRATSRFAVEKRSDLKYRA